MFSYLVEQQVVVVVNAISAHWDRETAILAPRWPSISEKHCELESASLPLRVLRLHNIVRTAFEDGRGLVCASPPRSSVLL